MKKINRTQKTVDKSCGLIGTKCKKEECKLFSVVLCSCKIDVLFDDLFFRETMTEPGQALLPQAQLWKDIMKEFIETSTEK